MVNERECILTFTQPRVKARSMLEKARLRNPKSPELWLESIRLENNSENRKLAATRLAQALQVRSRVKLSMENQENAF